MVIHVRAARRSVLATLSACAFAFGVAGSLDAAPLARSFPHFTSIVEDARPPEGWVQFCKDRPDECRTEKRVPRTPTMTDERMDELVRINLIVNRQIKPMTDLRNYRVKEKWTYPDNGYGDCEDFALLKRRMLIELGWPAESLLITIVWAKNDGHAVLLVSTDTGEYVLDNQNRKVLLWSKTRYNFVKRQSEHDPNKWVYIDSKSRTPTAVAETD